jgi:hypothetical protein
MSEILMQAIIEKLESVELLLKVEKTSEKNEEMIRVVGELQLLQKSIKSLPSQVLLGSVKMGELSANINQLSEQLQKPLNSRVVYKHELHKGFLISIGLFVVCIFLTWGWVNAYQTQNQFEANDIKYRSLKLVGNPTTLKLCIYTDSVFRRDPTGFRLKVELGEKQLIKEAEFFRLAGEKKESRALKKQGGHR